MSTVRIQLRRGTSSDWTSVNPTLAAGEAGYESDTHKIKIGTGTTAWTVLPYSTVTPTELSDAIAAGLGGQLTAYDVNHALGYTAADAADLTFLGSQTSTDIANAITTAENYAEGYTDNAISTEVTNRNSAIATAKSQAISTSEGYTDTKIATEVTNRNSAISSAIATEVTNRNSAIATSLSTAEGYTDSAISALVAAAPSTLNTLKEIADAINNDASIAATLVQQIGYAQANAEGYTDAQVGAEVTNRQSAVTAAISTAEGYTDTHIATEVTSRNSAIATSLTTAEGYTDTQIATEVTNRQAAVTAAISTAEGYTDTHIATEVTNRNFAIATAKSEAISTSEGYTDSAIASEVTNRNSAIATSLTTAEGYTDTKIATEVTNRNTAISSALSTSEGYTDYSISSATATIEGYTDTAIATEVTNRNSAIATAKSQAIATAESYADGLASNYDAAGSATTAKNDAKAYTDSSISTEVTNRNSAIATAKSQAITAAETYADGLATNYDPVGSSRDAKTYADGLISTEVTNRNSAILTAKNAAISTAEGYTDTAISNLVNASPATLDTLKELADAIGDDPNFATTVSSHIATAKADAEAYTDSSIATEVTARNSAISSAVATGKSQAISTSEAYTDAAISSEVSNRNTAIATSLSTAESYTDTAKNAAISTSETYTDSAISTEVTNRNSAILTAKNQAISTSEGYTDTAISTEVTNRNSAIATSLTTAENYADTAKSSAISTSEGYTDTAISTEVTNRNSAIATAKSQAISTSEGYTDTAISTEVTNRNSAIATSLTTAEGYTDTKIATEVTNRNSAISSAISTEVTNRNSAIATSLTTAEGYTDSAIATEVSNRNTAISNATAHMVQTTDTGSVTSAMIADGTIVNADISNSAAILASKIAGTAVTQADTATVTNTMLAGSIADSKLNTISTSGKVANSATTATDANTTGAIVSRDSSGNFNANMITLFGTPANAGDVVTKAYADSIASALNWHQAVYAATTAALPTTPVYANGTADQSNGTGIGAKLTAGSNAVFTIDGVNPTAGARVLIKDQVNQIQNGIYVVTDAGKTGPGAKPWILTRATDSNNSIAGQVAPGDAVFVQNGTINAGQGFIEGTDGTNTDLSIKIGTDNIHFYQFTGTATLTAGAGLVSTGNVLDVISSTLNVTTDSVDLATVSQTNTTGGNLANGIVTAVTVDSYGRVTGYQTGAQNIASTSSKGIASFNSASFTVTSGDVTIKNAGISNAQLANNSVTIGSTSVALGATAATVAGLTLTSPVIAQISNTGTLTLPTSTDTLVGRATTDTLTNKSISGSTNTLSNIGNSSLTNSSITVNGTSVSLGGSVSGLATNASPTFTGTVTLPLTTAGYVTTTSGGVISSVATIPNAGLTNSTISGVSLGSNLNALTIGTGLSGTSYNGSGAVTIANTGVLSVNGSAGAVTGIATTASPTFTGTVTLPLTTSGYVTTSGSGVISSVATIPNAGLTNSSTTIGTTAISLGSSSTTLAGLTSVTSTGFTGALTGNVTGNADTATKLATPRNINGVAFDGSAAITITAANPNALTIGTGLSGTSYTGSGAVTIAIDSTVATLTGVQTLTNKTLSSAVATGGITHNGSTSGTIVLQASAVAGSNTLTLPAATDTLVGKATTDTLTNKTLDTAGTGNVLKINGTQVSAVTGTGSVVLAASPTLTGTVSAAAVTTTGDVTVGGNLTVNGTTTTINSTTLNTTEQVLVISNAASPTDVTANGAGITIKGATDKTIKWYSSTGAVTFSENIDLASGKTYKINGTTVLSATAVGGQTIPASAIVGLTDTQTLTNKTISGSSNTLSNIANSSLTNSTISGVALGSNLAALTTGTGLTGASYNGSGAITHAIDTTVVATLTGTQTLTNKTLTSPSLGTPTVTGTITLSSSGATFSDSTVQTTAGVPSVTPIDNNVFATGTVNLASGYKDYMFKVGASVTVTLQQDSAATYPVGTSIDFYANGTGAAFAAGTGVTIINTPGLKFRAVGSVATAMKVATNTWLVFGDLSA